MYATLSYEIRAGSIPIEEVRAQILKVFEGNDTCDFLSDTFICAVKKTSEYLDLATRLEEVDASVAGQFQYVFTLHKTGGLIRTNTTFPKPMADEITGGDL